MRDFSKYPEPKEFGGLTAHQRSRIVIQAPSRADAEETAAKINALGMSCDLEEFVAHTCNETGELLGEFVAERKFYGVAFEAVKQVAEDSP